MTATHKHPALTQEFHYEASVEVASRLCAGEGDREALIDAATPLVEATTPHSRRRAATAVMSRLGLGRRRRVQAEGLHHLLAQLSPTAGRQLLAYVVARHEPIIRALAFEVLYPYFVEHSPPIGFTSEEFSAANANGLFELEDAITHTAVAAHAERRWSVSDPSVTRRVLRVLRKGGVLESAWVSRSGSRCLGHFPVIRVPDIAVFAYAMHGIAAEGQYVRVDRLWSGLLVHLFLMQPVAVDYLLERAEAAGLVERPRSGTALLRHSSLESAVPDVLNLHRTRA